MMADFFVTKLSNCKLNLKRSRKQFYIATESMCSLLSETDTQEKEPVEYLVRFRFERTSQCQGCTIVPINHFDKGVTPENTHLYHVGHRCSILLQMSGISGFRQEARNGLGSKRSEMDRKSENNNIFTQMLGGSFCGPAPAVPPPNFEGALSTKVQLPGLQKSPYMQRIKETGLYCHGVDTVEAYRRKLLVLKCLETYQL